MHTILRAAILVSAAVALTGAARAAEDESGAHRPGRAAAHAALADGADLPVNPPSLPELALEGGRRADPAAAAARRLDAPREAASQADQHAAESSRAERDEQANRIAQASVVAAVRSAANDAHVAAAQARSSVAKAKGPGHVTGPPHPVPKNP